MTPAEQESTINGAALRLAREARGWTLGDMAMHSCMSIRQIRQLEEGGSSSFYSVSVKLTAVKKVGTLLGLTQEQWFIAPAVALSAETAVAMVSQAETDALSNVSSFSESPSTELETDSDTQTPIAPSQNEASVSAPKPKVSLWAILGLFAAALGVAAVMRPAPESVVTESAPPPVLTQPNGEQEAVGNAATASDVAPVAQAASATVTSASAASAPVTAASAKSH
jgi:transcriptional regulator with XRE-family HTH domain